MEIARDGVHFAILDALCRMPRPVRGISGAMLDRRFGAAHAVRERGAFAGVAAAVAATSISPSSQPRTNAAASQGSNCEPAQRSTSSSAWSTGSARR